MDEINPRAQRWNVIVVASLWLSASQLSFIGGHVMLPTIAGDFDVSTEIAAWFTLSFTLGMAGGFVPASHIGNLMGHRRVALLGGYLEVGALIFIVFVPNFYTLLVLRFAQGTLHSLGLPNLNALVVGQFASSQRGRALGVMGTIAGSGMIVAPIAAGLITDAWGWRWVFGLNATLIMGLTIILAFASVGERRAQQGLGILRQADLLGAALLMGAVAPFILGVQFAAKGALYPIGIWAIGIAIVFLVLLLLHETRTRFPSLPLDLLKLPTVAVPSIHNLLFSFANGAILYAVPVFFVQGVGWSVGSIGLLIGVLSFGRPSASFVAGILADKFGVSVLVQASAFLLISGMLGLIAASATQHRWLLGGLLLIIGVGVHLFAIANQKDLYDALPQHQLATAPGILGLGRHISQTVGIGMAAGIFAAIAGALTPESIQTAVVAYRTTLVAVVGILGVGFFMVFATPILLNRKSRSS